MDGANGMTYEESLAWLYSTQQIGIKLGLDNTHRLLELLEIDPGDRTIFHVAGTNGKGSTCAFLESVCREAGLKTGLFTSPHLVSFRERIRIDFEPAPAETLAQILTRIRDEIQTWDPHPSFFEITTALGMRTFLDGGAEAIILETGLGGRLDSTNAVASSVTGITSISLDHQQWLGDSIAKIAEEKAGIIKAGKRLEFQGSPVIIDGAHNAEAAEALVRTWKAEFGDQKAAIVFGAVADKEPQKLLKVLSPITGALFPTTIATQRGMTADDLAKQIGESAQPAPSASLALRLAQATQLPILVTGSFFLAGQVLEVLGWGNADFEPSEQ